MKKQRLGRGLDALIPHSDESKNDSNLSEIDIRLVKPNPYQPRLEFEEQALDE